MKEKIVNLNTALKGVHRRFLEQERVQAEEYFQKKITPFEFLMMMTQDKNFSWMHPFSSLIAEIDAFNDEASKVEREDVKRISDQVEFLIKNENSKIYSRYNYHLNHDADFIMLHSELKKEMEHFKNR